MRSWRSSLLLSLLLFPVFAGCLGEPDRGCVMEARPEGPIPGYRVLNLTAAQASGLPDPLPRVVGSREGGGASATCSQGLVAMQGLADAGAQIRVLGDVARDTWVERENVTLHVVLGKAVA